MIFSASKKDEENSLVTIDSDFDAYTYTELKNNHGNENIATNIENTIPLINDSKLNICSVPAKCNVKDDQVYVLSPL